MSDDMQEKESTSVNTGSEPQGTRVVRGPLQTILVGGGLVGLTAFLIFGYQNCGEQVAGTAQSVNPSENNRYMINNGDETGSDGERIIEPEWCSDWGDGSFACQDRVSGDCFSDCDVPGGGSGKASCKTSSWIPCEDLEP